MQRRVMDSTGHISKFRARLGCWRSSMRILWLALGSFAVCITAQANLLTNGDFEQPGSALTTDVVGVGAGTQITGWTTTLSTTGSGPNNYYSHTNSSDSWIPNPESGSYSVQLDSNNTLGGNGNSIAQTLSLVSGHTYSLSFWINSESQSNLTSSSVILSLTGATNFSNTTYTAPGYLLNSGKTQAWTHQTVSFTMTASGNETIKFTDAPGNANTNDVSLDNVDLEAVTPEFSHWSIPMVFALLFVGFELRRRHRRS
jgi:hypothetical protein